MERLPAGNSSESKTIPPVLTHEPQAHQPRAWDSAVARIRIVRAAACVADAFVIGEQAAKSNGRRVTLLVSASGLAHGSLHGGVVCAARYSSVVSNFLRCNVAGGGGNACGPGGWLIAVALAKGALVVSW